MGVLEWLKLLICDLDRLLRWYMIKGGVLRDFLKSGSRGLILDSETI